MPVLRWLIDCDSGISNRHGTEGRTVNRRSVIRAAGWLCIAYGELPSRRNIQRRIAETNDGRTFGSDEIHDVLRTAPYPELGPVPVQARSSVGPASGPAVVLKNGDSGPVSNVTQVQARSLVRAESNIRLESTDSSATHSRPSGITPRAKRISPTPKPLPNLPEAVKDDYERLVYNDAQKRRTKDIAESVVAKDLLVLRRAYEKHGAKALEHGIEIAIRQGKGVRFAAACVRNYDAPDETMRVPTFRDRPRSADRYEGQIHSPTAAERDYGIDR
jgi:hypothetical protein